MSVRVLKFGGTSVADAEAIKRVIKIVSEKQSKMVIVVSACSQITNKLNAIIAAIHQPQSDFKGDLAKIKNQHLEIAKQLDCSQSTYDFIHQEISRVNGVCEELESLGCTSKKHSNAILVTGERLSSAIIADAMQQQMQSVAHIDAEKLIAIKTRDDQLIVDFPKTKNQVEDVLNPLLENTDRVVIAGFICTDEDKNISNLGRGGSDYSAAIVGNCLAAEAIEIWTDVDGILSSDPKAVSDARLIGQLSYQEAAELAYFGAKVLHPKTIGPASRLNIPVYVKNTFKPESQGTKILEAIRSKDTIKSIASRSGICVVNIHSNHMYGAYGFMRRVFEVFDKFHCPVDVVTTSEVSVSITIEDVSQLQLMLKELNTFANTQHRLNQSIIAVVGDGLKQTAGIAAKIFTALKDIPVSMISMGASEVNLTLVVDEMDHDIVIQKLHNTFF